MSQRRMPRLSPAVFALAFILLAALPASALTPTISAISSKQPQTIELSTGKSVVLESSASIHRVSVAAPEVAEILMLSPKQVYVTAKTAGTTNVTLWGGDDKLLAVYDLVVAVDVGPLKEMLHQIMPEEDRIQVLSTKESITLSGTVSSPEHLASAVTLAEAYVEAPEQIINLLSVGGVNQVMLEVRVAEMSRDVMRRLGFNLSYLFNGAASFLTGENFFTFLNTMTWFDELGRYRYNPDKVTASVSIPMGNANWNAVIDALKENGVVKILAEPNLVCLSGATADFLAGGEIPIPAPQGLGTVAIEYKPFGVALEFTPTVLGAGRISMAVKPEVSELDYSNAIDISGITVPALTTRRTSTTVELNNGQSLLIAGLIKDNLRESVQKLPAIGDIPVLGALFRSSQFQKNQTELVIIVTPHLAKPLDMAEQTLPTDDFREPNDFEFYLLGLVEKPDYKMLRIDPKKEEQGHAGVSNGFDGEFGHTLPEHQ